MEATSFHKGPIETKWITRKVKEALFNLRASTSNQHLTHPKHASISIVAKYHFLKSILTLLNSSATIILIQAAQGLQLGCGLHILTWQAFPA